MVDLLKAFTVGLFKIPEDPGNDRELFLWRLKLVSITTILAAAVVVHQLQAYGVMFGPGFATVAEVGEINAKLIAIEIDKVDTEICMSPDAVLINYRQTLMGQYEEAAGRPYERKPCELLLRLIRE